MYLPVSYLSDERKGEVISKISNDVQEIEWSIQSAIKGVFKEPINILVFLGSLFEPNYLTDLDISKIVSDDKEKYRQENYK